MHQGQSTSASPPGPFLFQALPIGRYGPTKRHSPDHTSILVVRRLLGRIAESQDSKGRAARDTVAVIRATRKALTAYVRCSWVQTRQSKGDGRLSWQVSQGLQVICLVHTEAIHMSLVLLISTAAGSFCDWLCNAMGTTQSYLGVMKSRANRRVFISRSTISAVLLFFLLALAPNRCPAWKRLAQTTGSAGTIIGDLLARMGGGVLVTEEQSAALLLRVGFSFTGNTATRRAIRGTLSARGVPVTTALRRPTFHRQKTMG